MKSPMAVSTNPAQEAEQLVQAFADGTASEDVQYHLHVLEKIKRGRADIADSRCYTQEEAKQRLSRWLQL